MVIETWCGVFRHSWRRYCLPMDYPKTCLRLRPRAWLRKILALDEKLHACVSFSSCNIDKEFDLLSRTEGPHNNYVTFYNYTIRCACLQLCLIQVIVMKFLFSFFYSRNYVNGFWFFIYSKPKSDGEGRKRTYFSNLIQEKTAIE